MNRVVKRWLIRAGYRTRPAFLIVGAQKGGTTSLHHDLAQHPRLVTPLEKEVGFFSDDERFARGTVWYDGLFPLPHRIAKGSIAFEATPEYLYYARCADRIHRYDPSMKIVAILRDPVERAFSAWNMFRNFKDDPVHFRLHDPRSFPEALRREMESMASPGSPEEPSYVRRGLYLVQLQRFAERFGRERLYVTENRRLRRERGKVLDEILAFVGLDPVDWRILGDSDRNVGRYEGEGIDPESERLLTAFYRPHNERLFDWLGVRYAWRT